MRFEVEGRFEKFSGLFLKMDFQIFVRVILAVPLVQFRFGIEQVHLARSAMLEKANNCLGFGRMMGRFGSEWMKSAGDGDGRRPSFAPN